MDDYLTVSEAAAILKIDDQTLRRAADAGEIPSTRMPFGRRDRRFDPSVIAAVAQRMRAEASGAAS